MKTNYYTHTFSTVCLKAFAALFAFGLMSCDSFIFDDEGDCDPYYKVRFVYDMNMKFADAFANEVKDVTLYVIDDRTGRVVLTKHESGDALSQPGYMMDVEVEPGNYSLVAWCGEGHRTSFTVTGSEMKTDLTCSLTDRQPHQPGPWDNDSKNTAEAEEDTPKGSHVRNMLHHLYHGKLEAQEFPDTQGTHIYTVRLTKNTNDIHIVLQHLSGEPVDEKAFTFTITDENGLMDWDNSLLADEPLTYFAWHKKAGIAGLEVPDYTDEDNSSDTRASIVQVSAAVAELSVGRLMESRRYSTFVNIYNQEGERIVHLPYIDYFLLVKSERLKNMSDQEYLDRQDDYSMVFFLDEDNRWVKSHIFINSWKIVLQTVNPQ